MRTIRHWTCLLGAHGTFAVGIHNILIIFGFEHALLAIAAFERLVWAWADDLADYVDELSDRLAQHRRAMRETPS